MINKELIQSKMLNGSKGLFDVELTQDIILNGYSIKILQHVTTKKNETQEGAERKNQGSCQKRNNPCFRIIWAEGDGTCMDDKQAN